MTRQNILLQQHLRRGLAKGAPADRRFLFTVNSTRISRIDLALLRICLYERDERGIFISVERPDRTMETLLGRMNIAPASIGSADTGATSSPMAGPVASPPAKKKVYVVSGLMCPTLFLDAVEAGMRSGGQKSELLSEISSLDFIMLDNLSAMGIYNTMPKVAEVFSRLQAFISHFASMNVIMVADKNIYPEVYAMARKYADRETEIGEEWFA